MVVYYLSQRNKPYVFPIYISFMLVCNGSYELKCMEFQGKPLSSLVDLSHLSITQTIHVCMLHHHYLESCSVLMTSYISCFQLCNQGYFCFEDIGIPKSMLGMVKNEIINTWKHHNNCQLEKQEYHMHMSIGEKKLALDSRKQLPWEEEQ